MIPPQEASARRREIEDKLKQVGLGRRGGGGGGEGRGRDPGRASTQGGEVVGVEGAAGDRVRARLWSRDAVVSGFW